MTGYISQIIGPVIDVHFPDLGEENMLPGIHEAMTIKKNDGSELIVEVQQHIGENTVRSIAMDSTDGLQRHLPVTAEGKTISMPVGDQVKGRLMNVTGNSTRPVPHLSTGNRLNSMNSPPRRKFSTRASKS